MEYEGFRQRDLSEHAIVYLFVDGVTERLRPGGRREAVLVAWGISEDGRKVLPALIAGSKEDVETVHASFRTCESEASVIRCSSFPMARRGSSGLSRSDRAAGPAEFLEQQNLIGIFAGEAIGGQHANDVHLPIVKVAPSERPIAGSETATMFESDIINNGTSDAVRSTHVFREGKTP